MNSRDQLIEGIQAAHALHQAGDYTQAEEKYLNLLASAPDQPLVNNLIGLLYLQTGRAQAASHHIERALHAQPEDDQARFNLALALIRQGLVDQAAGQLKHLLADAPNHVEALGALGNIERLRGNLKAALSHLARARDLAPLHTGVLLNSGLAFTAAGSYEDAQACFLRAIEQSPTMSEAHVGLGDLRMAQERARSAIDAYHAALKLSQSADIHNKLGVALNAQEDAEGARSEFEEAIRLDPLHKEAAINLAITLEQFGEMQDAERVVRAALARNNQFGAAHYQLVQLATDSVSDDDIDAMRQANMRSTRTEDPEDRVLLHYALGHALDRKGRYEDAFAAFRTAHKLKAKTTDFDLDRHLRQVDWFRSQFSELSELELDHPPLIFVLGMPRSGTTLTEQILASHSKVKALGERPVIGKLAARIEERTGTPFPAALEKASENQLRECAKACIETYTSLGNGLVVVDTTPTNYMFAGLIANLFGRARIVHCSRHPVDTCLSIYQYPLSDAHAYAHDLSTLGSYHLAYRQLIAHFRHIIGFRFFDLRYEDLVDRTEQEIRSLLGFCGLDFEPACLEFHKLERRIRTPSASQVRQPIHRSSVGRWKNYEPYLAPLIAALGSPEG